MARVPAVLLQHVRQDGAQVHPAAVPVRPLGQRVETTLVASACTVTSRDRSTNDAQGSRRYAGESSAALCQSQSLSGPVDVGKRRRVIGLAAEDHGEPLVLDQG